MTITSESTVQVGHAPLVRIAVACAITGLTDKAIRCKIADGKWLEGREYHRDPDNNIWIDVKGVMRWVAPGRA